MYRVPNASVWAYSLDELEAISEEEYQRTRAEVAHKSEEMRPQITDIVERLWRDPIKAFLDPVTFQELQQTGIPWPGSGYLLHLWCTEWGAPIFARQPLHARSAIEDERRAWMECCKVGILPIGTEAIVNLRVSDDNPEQGEQFAQLWAPLEGDLYATCAIRARFGRTTCHAFRLADPVHDGDDGPYSAWRETGEVGFYVCGDPEAPLLRCWCDAVRDWIVGSTGEFLGQGPGRPRKTIPYDAAQVTYWHLCECLESAGEHRKPSVREVCEHLSMQGLSIGKTRFTEHVTQWRAEGLSWPPPALDLIP